MKMHSNLYSLVAVAAMAVAFVSTTTALPASAETGASDTLIVARGGAHPLLLWDATAAVTADVKNKVPKQRALNELESNAITLAAAKAASMTSAETISVRIMYQKTGAVSEVYRTATFTGVEKVVTMTVPRQALAQKAAGYAAALKSGSVPADIQIQKTGQLP